MRFCFVIAAYELEESIYDTLESIENQTYKNYRIYIKLRNWPHSDDVRKIKKYKNIEFVVSPDNGIYSAFNQAIDYIPTTETTRSLVVFFGQGDKLFSNSVLENLKIKAELAEKDTSIYYCKVYIEQRNGCIKKSFFRWNPNLPNPFIGRRFIPCHQGVIEDLRILKEVGFSEKYKICGDAKQLYDVLTKKNIKIKSEDIDFSIMAFGGVSKRRSKYFLRLYERIIIAIGFYLRKLKTY